MYRVSKKCRRLIKNRIKVFCFIFRISSILDIPYPNLDFEIKIVEIRWKLSEIYYFEVDHTKFNKSNFDDFWVIKLPNFRKE